MTESPARVEGEVKTRRPPSWLPKVLGADLWITGTMFVLLVVITFSGALMRYFFNSPFSWLEEVQLALFLGVVYLGAGSAFRYGGHVAIDFVVDRLPAAPKRVVEVFVHAVVVLVLGYFAWQGVGLTSAMADSGRATNILKIPAVLIYATVPVGMVWMIINYLYTVVYGVIEDEAPEVSEDA